MDEKLDLKELLDALNDVLPDDNSPGFITRENCAKIETTLFSVRDHVVMRQRKRREEEESYRVANESHFGWMTEKQFRKDSVFLNDDDEEVDWWHKPELSIEKKMEKLRSAEREAKFQLSNKKFKHQFKERSSFKGQGSYPSKFNQAMAAVPGQWRPRMQLGNTDTRVCHLCLNVGHVQRFCPQRMYQAPRVSPYPPQLGVPKPRAPVPNYPGSGN